MDLVIYIRKGCRYLERECVGRFRDKRGGI